MTDQIQANFASFHAQNPIVYQLFDRYAREMLTAVGKGSAKLIFERIRWELTIKTTMDAPKLNNNYTALYARLWEQNHPQHAGFFSKRVRRKHTIDSTEFDPEEA